MNFEALFNNLCRYVDLGKEGFFSKEEVKRYKAGVFETLAALGLTKEYFAWCKSHGIYVDEFYE